MAEAKQHIEDVLERRKTDQDTRNRVRALQDRLPADWKVNGSADFDRFVARWRIVEDLSREYGVEQNEGDKLYLFRKCMTPEVREDLQKLLPQAQPLKVDFDPVVDKEPDSSMIAHARRFTVANLRGTNILPADDDYRSLFLQEAKQTAQILFQQDGARRDGGRQQDGRGTAPKSAVPPRGGRPQKASARE